MINTTGTFYINLDIQSTRFDFSKFMRWNDDNLDPLTSLFLHKLKEINPGGFYRINGEEGRPDLVSYNIYGSTQGWWLLLYYNDIIDPESLSNGDTLKYPLLSDLEDLYFSLKTLEQSNT